MNHLKKNESIYDKLIWNISTWLRDKYYDSFLSFAQSFVGQNNSIGVWYDPPINIIKILLSLKKSEQQWAMYHVKRYI